MGLTLHPAVVSQLFGSDLPLAQAALRHAWQTPGVVKGQLAHWGINLGLAPELTSMLDDPACHWPESLRWKLRFRLGRLAQDPTAFVSMVAADKLTEIADLVQGGDAVAVVLDGGIGDHLEQLSLLLPWSCQAAIELQLVCVMPGRASQLGRLLQALPGITLLEGPPPHGRAIQAMVLRLWIQSQQPLISAPWIPVEPAPSSRQLVCCWRAVGQGDALSMHQRSLPFGLVQQAYHQLLDQGWQITDITTWQPWELAVLQQLGIRSHNPAHGDVLDLAKLVAGANVISIDTALAHLCAAMGQQAQLLLPLYADERWLELLSPNQGYATWLQVWQQRRYGDWGEVLNRLLQSAWARSAL